MYPIIGSWCGITIYSYGTFIALGICIVLLLMRSNKKLKNLLTPDQQTSAFLIGIVSAVVGGKILYCMTTTEKINSFQDFFENIGAGFAIAGSILCGIIFVPVFLYLQKVPILPVFDIIAPLLALLQGFGRVGCFFAGCCSGMPCDFWWGITYTDPQSLAPCAVPLHPTQLYSACLLFLLAGVLWLIKARIPYIPNGWIAALYLMGAGIERFCTDFTRADYSPTLFHGLFSSAQIWACIVFVAGVSMLIISIIHEKNFSESQKKS